MKEISKQEQDYIVNMFFNESIYAKRTKKRTEIINNFLRDFLITKSFLLDKYKVYKPQEVLEIIKKFYDGNSYIENDNNIVVKTDKNWKTCIYLKADLVFFYYISNNYNFEIYVTHEEIIIK